MKILEKCNLLGPSVHIDEMMKTRFITFNFSLITRREKQKVNTLVHSWFAEMQI